MSDTEKSQPTTRRLAAILFSDIVGYTALMGRDADQALALVRQCKAIQQPLVEQNGGTWVKEIGDGLMARFDSAIDAVHCAIAIQQQAGRELSNTSLRIGIHLGDITIEANDVFGDGVNVASRLESMAPAGGVLISESVHRAIRGEGDIRVSDLGTQKLKNVDYPVRTYALQAEGIPLAKSTAKSRKRVRMLVAAASVLIILVFGWMILVHQGGGSRSAHEANAIAVLPFTNMSGEDDAYFAMGVTEDILTHISRIGDLRVLSSFTLRDYDATGKTVQEIGEELGVSHLLTGSIRKAGEELRISCQLVQVDPEEQTWAENFDRHMEDVFAIQNEVATEVAKYLRAQLTEEEENRLKRKPTESLEAYNLYLRGLSRYLQEKVEENELAINLFKEALAIDPDFTSARVQLLSAYLKSISQYGLRSYDLYDSLLLAAERLVYNDPESPEALSLLSYNYAIKGDYKKAIDLSEKAIQLKPNDSKSINTLGLLLRNQGKIDKAIPLFKKVKELDPLRLQVYNYNLGTCYELLGMYELANTYFNSTLELSPDDLINIDRLAHISLVTGQLSQTEKFIDHLLELKESLKAIDYACEFSLNAGLPMEKTKKNLRQLVNHPQFNYLDNHRGTIALAYVLKKENQQDSLNRVLEGVYEAYSAKWGLEHDDGDVMIPYARIAALQDDKDVALDWIQKMANTGSIWTYELMQSDLVLDEVRKDPRYDQIMEPIKKKRDRLRMSVSAQVDQIKL